MEGAGKRIPRTSETRLFSSFTVENAPHCERVVLMLSKEAEKTLIEWKELVLE